MVGGSCMKKIFIAMMSFAVMLTSCAKEEDLAADTLGTSGCVSFRALLETSLSKTALNDDMSVGWLESDQVRFDYQMTGEDTEYKGSVVSSPVLLEDGSARFVVEGLPDAYLYSKNAFIDQQGKGATRFLYATYPATVETDCSELEAFMVTVPSGQEGTFGSASVAIACYDTDKPWDPLRFFNLCGLFTITVNDTRVSTITLSSGAALAGKAYVDFVEGVPVVTGMAEAEKSVTLNIEKTGTYYIGVLPGELDDVVLGFYDVDGKFVGEKKASQVIKVGRAELWNLGTFGEEDYDKPAEDGFFVKPEASGLKDGSDWDNAADYAELWKRLDNSTNGATADKAVSMTVYMSGGVHNVTAQLNVSPAHDVRIYGGYPEDATGVGLSGRDVAKNPTVLDAAKTDDSDLKIWNLTNGTWIVDGLTFQNAKASAGAAITLQKTVSMTVTDCVFRNNEATGAGGGAVLCQGLTSESVLFEDCEFVGNSASTTTSASSGLGGAVMGSSLPQTPGTITFSKCLFKENTAALGGGAICPRTMNCRLMDCTFVDNSGESYGDAIYLENSATVTTYCDGCNFYYTDSKYVKATSAGKNATITVNNTNSRLGISNTVVNGPWAGSTSQILVLKSKSVVIVNSTLFAQTGYPLVLVQGGDTHAINSILLNAASDGKGRGIANQSAAYVYNSVFTKVDEKVDGKNVEVTAKTAKTDYSNNLKVVSKTAETFPVDPTWYGSEDYAALMWGNKNAATIDVDDCRGKLYYYAWDGVYPEEHIESCIYEVKALVEAADADFAEWLGDNIWKDIRGEERGHFMWPGSYQN